jgi:hypothetical protein
LGLPRIFVDFGGHNFQIPPLPASEWLKVLLAESIDLEAVFPGLAGPETIGKVNSLILDGAGSQDELEQVILDVLEVAAGRRWWIALRLCVSVRAHWEWVGGDLARHGVSPFDVPLSYWLDGAYATMIQGIMDRTDKPRRVSEWTRALTDPPPQERRREVADDDGSAFLAALRMSR